MEKHIAPLAILANICLRWQSAYDT